MELEARITDPPRRTLFLYLGRRGAMSQFARDLAANLPGEASLAISRQNELHDEIVAANPSTIVVDTFARATGAVLRLPRLWPIRTRLVKEIRARRIDTVAALMPHVWTPLLVRPIQKAGARYVVVVHDAAAHPGDPTGVLNRWLLREARLADRVVALSEHVKRQLVDHCRIPAEKMRVLFHPRLGRPGPPREDGGVRPITFLFFGRILRYKGLPFFVQACEILRREGFEFRILVAGEGDLGEFSGRLAALGAEVINRWVTHEEAGALMARSDAAVVPSIEASQSGVVALAHGSGVPVIATPVGGLVEQVSDGVTGLLADAVSATSVAAAMRRFLQEPELRDELAAALARSSEFSMRQFVEAIAKLD